MSRREITSQLIGPDGNFTETFGPETIRILVDLGLIKNVGTSEEEYPEQNLVRQINFYRKA